MCRPLGSIAETNMGPIFGPIDPGILYFQFRLVLRENYLIVWEIFIPLGDQFFAGPADVFTVDDRAGEHAWDVQAVAQGRVRAKGNRQVSIQVDGGREDSQPIHLDGAAGAVELDDLVA